MNSPANRVLAFAKKRGIIRPRDVEALGIPRHTVAVLYRSGHLERVGRGLYVHANARPTENHDLALLSVRIPDAVVCLLSALRFHELTTQIPPAHWIGIAPKSRRPHVHGLALEVVRFSGRALTEGVDIHPIEGVQVPITSPARTVADCFKYRNKIGRDIAVEALRDAIDQRKAGIRDLVRYGALGRVSQVMRPYLELYM